MKMKRKIKAKHMDYKQLGELYDKFYDMDNCGLKSAQLEWAEEHKDEISNAITDYYDICIKFNKTITDGQEMFDYWAYEWFKNKWVFKMKNSNWKKFPIEML
tara:strand:+ start:308 stop:613 length:306 start_codon:yes stop_codon:yes gene_type:complete